MTNTPLTYCIYIRRNQEPDKQQQLVNLKLIVKSLNLYVVDIITDSSASTRSGQPGFHEMINQIRKGKANGIICHQIISLTRNCAADGLVFDLMKSGALQHVYTPDNGYWADDLITNNLMFLRLTAQLENAREKLDY